MPRSPCSMWRRRDEHDVCGVAAHECAFVVASLSPRVRCYAGRIDMRAPPSLQPPHAAPHVTRRPHMPRPAAHAPAHRTRARLTIATILPLAAHCTASRASPDTPPPLAAVHAALAPRAMRATPGPTRACTARRAAPRSPRTRGLPRRGPTCTVMGQGLGSPRGAWLTRMALSLRVSPRCCDRGGRVAGVHVATHTHHVLRRALHAAHSLHTAPLRTRYDLTHCRHCRARALPAPHCSRAPHTTP
jgi:hypothetical protein